MSIILPFDDGEFTTLYADPPWPEYGGGKIKRGADKHYILMSISQIIDLGKEVERITTENSHAYIWTTNNYLPAALDVMEAWGYTYKTMITWTKDRMGLGQYFRGMTEHCLFGVRGMIPYRLNKTTGKRAQGKTVFNAVKTKHSQKPQEMRDMIELVSPYPYLEMFARTSHQHWSVWGNEAGGSNE